MRERGQTADGEREIRLPNRMEKRLGKLQWKMVREHETEGEKREGEREREAECCVGGGETTLERSALTAVVWLPP